MQNLTIDSIENFWNPGVFIDIDGVVLQGGKPFEWSKDAIHALWNNNIPFVFVTNGTYCSALLVDNLTNILELPLTTDHVVVAPSPCSALTQYHDKRVLVCCQEDSIGLISELGFTNFLTVEDLVQIFPELDYVDHIRRKILQQTPITPERQKAQDEFKPIEAILLLGEPINWECSLQILIDILMTNGDPRTKFKFVPNPHLPIIACNKDLTFKGAAALPRFGHGAFLECLESLYMKITKNELVYEELMGKPHLVTYEFAVEQIQRLSINGNIINKFYFIGDNPDVDIRGANNFKTHLLELEHKSRKSSRHTSCQVSRHHSRQSSRRHSLVIPGNNLLGAELKRIGQVESILVCTGVYNPNNDLLIHLKSLFNETQIDSNNNQADDPNKLEISTLSLSDQNNNRSRIPIIRNDSNASLLLDEIDKRDLRLALSRKNSFISYFDNKDNIPDLTVNTLKDAVDYIIKCNLNTVEQK